MISTFKLKFGRSPGAPAESISATPVTVFVGPNNSGKSRVLNEIQTFCRTGVPDHHNQILEQLTFTGLPADAVTHAVERLVRPPGGNRIAIDQILIGSSQGQHVVHRANFEKLIENPAGQYGSFCETFLTHGTLALNGHNRIGLVSQQDAGDLQQPANSSLQVLFRSDAKRCEVRRIIHEAFGVHFVIDPTALRSLRIRLSSRAPVNDIEERGIHDEAIKFHSAAQHIDLASDGVKAFTGIVTELIAGDPRVLLIDEPEAFLHPSLASQLGKEVARAAVTEGKRVFVSTHSPAFLMGCVQSGAPVNIVRLTYRDGAATARLLQSDRLLELMRHPLLRSTGVLSGLFYEFVVVTESDSDRAFYQEVNDRLLQFRPEWGIPNCLFINAQNKQTVQNIIGPLRQLGIPAVGVVDVDVMKEGGAPWIKLLSAANIPPLSHQGLAAQRAAVKGAMDKTQLDMKLDGGVDILDPLDREAALNLIAQLAEYGVFVVKGGELESWLKKLVVPGHGSNWLIGMFEKMGEDPAAAAYVKPEDGDVWKFISELRTWMVNPNRKGIPT